MGVEIRTHRRVLLSGPPTAAVQCLRVGLEVLRLMPELVRPVGLVVLAVRDAAIEPWEVRGLAPGPYVDDLIRAIAAYGEEPGAVIVPHTCVGVDARGRRTQVALRILAECCGRRASLELLTARRLLLPRDLGPAPEPGWIGASPPAWLRLEALGQGHDRLRDPSDLC